MAHRYGRFKGSSYTPAFRKLGGAAYRKLMKEIRDLAIKMARNPADDGWRIFLDQRIRTARSHGVNNAELDAVLKLAHEAVKKQSPATRWDDDLETWDTLHRFSEELD